MTEEYCTSHFKRDNSPDSCILALTNLSQSLTIDTLSQRSFFCLGTNVHVFCSNPVPMCRGTDTSGAYLPAKLSTARIHSFVQILAHHSLLRAATANDICSQRKSYIA